MSDDMFYARVCQERDALRAELAAAKEERVKQWRCYHCDQVFADPIMAAAHFGDDRKNPKPAACEGLLNAYAEAFERYGVHRNHHNVASVKQLANKFQGEVDKLRAERTALRAHVERLQAGLGFYAKPEHWMAQSEHWEEDRCLIANGRNRVSGHGWEEAQATLAATPSQSLAEIKAAALREAAKLMDPDGGCYEALMAEADRIEKEAANG